MPQENVTAARYGARAGDFIRNAAVLCRDIHEGWLPSAGLLLGFACELLAKRRLLHDGVSEGALRNAPYGHDISGMWRDRTELFAETEIAVSKLKQNENPDVVYANFDWGLHFDQLAQAHAREGDYSLRYHHGEIHFADPKAVTVVLSNIWLSEQEKSLKWSALWRSLWARSWHSLRGSPRVALDRERRCSVSRCAACSV
jgi:hypothetical protein